MVYKTQEKNILELITKLTKEKEISWTVDYERRTFSTKINCNTFVEIRENLIPPRWYSYEMKIWDETFEYLIKDQDDILKNLFQYILNNDVSKRKKIPLKNWLDNIIISLKELESTTKKEEKVKKNKKTTKK